jgi:fluoride exporter
MTLLWVMTGSAVGTIARVWLVERVQLRYGSRFPWGTLLVNTSGALLIGLLAGGLIRTLPPAGDSGWALLVVGLLGSYTTVSSFSLQTLALWQARKARLALLNVLASFMLCLLSAAAGLLLAGVFA